MESEAWHIYPVNDLEEHDLEGTTCKCGPKVEFPEDGGMLVIHNAFDLRELVEMANEVLGNK